MRFITTKAHGAMDYLLGAILIVAPWLLGFHRGGPETWVPVSLGAAAAVYSLMTDYELGAVRVMPMRTHLSFDFVSGIILAASPWLFGFTGLVFWPHAVLGALLAGTAFFTQTIPQGGASRRGRSAIARRSPLGNAA